MTSEGTVIAWMSGRKSVVVYARNRSIITLSGVSNIWRSVHSIVSVGADQKAGDSTPK